jgi:hypothetical protein
MNAKTLAMEKELKESGWTPLAVHPNSPIWRAPDGQLHPGPGYAWLVMLEQKHNAMSSKQQLERRPDE